MKTLTSIILLLLLSLATCYAQQGHIDASMLRLKGLDLTSEKKAIVEIFGKPKKIWEPKYECGFHSEDVQGKKYYQLAYDNIAFIGNEKEKYTIESIDFKPNSGWALAYGKWKFNEKTTVNDLAKIFGESVRELETEHEGTNTGILLFFKGGDDGLMFLFESGYLITTQHWSPC